jgi:hypothetical protein
MNRKKQRKTKKNERSKKIKKFGRMHNKNKNNTSFFGSLNSIENNNQNNNQNNVIIQDSDDHGQLLLEHLAIPTESFILKIPKNPTDYVDFVIDGLKPCINQINNLYSNSISDIHINLYTFESETACIADYTLEDIGFSMDNINKHIWINIIRPILINCLQNLLDSNGVSCIRFLIESTEEIT